MDIKEMVANEQMLVKIHDLIEQIDDPVLKYFNYDNYDNLEYKLSVLQKYAQDKSSVTDEELKNILDDFPGNDQCWD